MNIQSASNMIQTGIDMIQTLFSKCFFNESLMSLSTGTIVIPSIPVTKKNLTQNALSKIHSKAKWKKYLDLQNSANVPHRDRGMWNEHYKLVAGALASASQQR